MPNPNFPVYCENINGLFIEPVNFFTNAAIVISAILAFILIRKNKIKLFEFYVAVLFLFLSGVGSGLWHFFRTDLTLSLDILPVGLFLFTIVFIFFKYLTGSRIKATGLILLLFGLIYLVFSLIPFRTINLNFALMLLILGTILIWARFKFGSIANEGILAALLLALAIGFRTFDLYVCDYIPFGTHFLWHIINSIAAYIALDFLVKLENLKIRKKEKGL